MTSNLRDSTVSGPSSAFESGTAIERLRCSPSAEGTRVGRARDGDKSPLVWGGGGVWGPPHENFVIVDD